MRHSPGRILACLALGLSSLLVSPVALAGEMASPEAPPPAYLQTTPSPSIADNNMALMQEFLARYRNAQPWQPVPEGRALKPHMKNVAVMLLRKRLQATGDLAEPAHSGEDVYDPILKLAVASYQLRMGLKADGIAGANTLHELNVPLPIRIRQIEVNLERWKTLTPHLGPQFVMVNIPDFRLYVYENGRKLFDMETIVGRPSRPTPEISSRITRLVFNPSWNVPQLIARKDIVPKAANNPDYLTDMNIRIFNSPGSNADEISPEEIDWNTVQENGFPYYFRQDPGVDNSLGLVKFEFPNTNSIYLHDTPAKSLFSQDRRMFSSGCIRLQNPFALVSYLMSTDPEWDDARMQGLLDDGKTAYVRAPHSVPIFITYLTAWVDETGALNFRDDIYGKDDPATQMASAGTDPVAPE